MIYTFVETSATRFLTLGSLNGAVGPGKTPCTIRPKTEPLDLICLVSARVSILHIPGMF